MTLSKKIIYSCSVVIFFLDLFRDFSKSSYEHNPISIGLLDSKTASRYVPVLIASTVFFVDPVSLAICEPLNSVGYLFISHKIA